MNKYFALRKANRMRTKLLNEKSQEQLKDVIRYFCPAFIGLTGKY